MAVQVYNEKDQLKKKGLKRKHQKILETIRQEDLEKKKKEQSQPSEKGESGEAQNGEIKSSEDHNNGEEKEIGNGLAVEGKEGQEGKKPKRPKREKNRRKNIIPAGEAGQGDKEGEGSGNKSQKSGGGDKGKSSEDEQTDAITKSLKEALKYLQVWKHSRSEWKFKKARQVFLLKNIYDPFRIPKEEFSYLLEYLEGVQGSSKQKTVDEAKMIYEAAEEELRKLKTEMEEVEKKMSSSSSSSSSLVAKGEEGMGEGVQEGKENNEASSGKEASGGGDKAANLGKEMERNRRRQLKLNKLRDQITMEKIKLFRARKILMML
eukprot:Nk52_evm26s2325 gene=Nk52_evmTU26s2325